MPTVRARLLAVVITGVVLTAVLVLSVPSTSQDANLASIASILQYPKDAAGAIYDTAFEGHAPIPEADFREVPPPVAKTGQEVQDIQLDVRPTPLAGTKSPSPSPAGHAAAQESIKPPKGEPEDWTGVDVTKLADHYIYNDVDNVHRRISSVSTLDGKYFDIDFINAESYNPSILPHHVLDDTYIVVSQHKEHSVEMSVYFAQIICNAKFMDGKLKCLKEPLILPIAATFGEGLQCPDEMRYIQASVGPHDARVFYGPKKPYALYGSNSKHPCFGQWVQDFRLLMDWGWTEYAWEEFKYGTELNRPDDWNYMEKNWFIFWDAKEQMYLHHDVYPERVFAKLEVDGTVGPNLAPAAGDDACLAAFMPFKARVLEGIHQATNSLSITLCKRSDPGCVPTDANTVIFTIFQHKSYYAFHGNYEPYVMAFKQSAPFSLYGISTKPLFINGRTRPGDFVRPDYAPEGQTDMFYVTSISWKAKGMKYHGFLDDILFLGFGIEDSYPAAIDVVAGDLFLDMGLCSSVNGTSS